MSCVGRAHLGKITASMYISAQLTSAGGAFVFGIAKDATGSYRPLFLFLIAGLSVQGAGVALDGLARARAGRPRAPE